MSMSRLVPSFRNRMLRSDRSRLQPDAVPVETSPRPNPAPAERDLRLDLFRGIALWLIFLDHIPSNVVNWITIRNYGFSDATEIFVFISGRSSRSSGSRRSDRDFRCEG
jgi:hypothetical protein